MSLSPTSIFGDLFPSVDMGPPRAQGGSLDLTFELNNVETEVQRSNDQSQDVFQGARAFSGSQANNTLQQDENLVQDGSGRNDKTVTFQSPADAGDTVTIDDLSTRLFASRFLAKGRGENLQDQVGGQSAVNVGYDAAGNPSQARNELIQQENIDQNIESVTHSNFDLRSNGVIWNQAGVRKVDAIFDDQTAEGNLFNRQRQGYTTTDPAQKGNTLFDNPSTQFASSDAGVSLNNLVQDALGTQKNKTGVESILDFRRDPAELADTGQTQVTLTMNGDFTDGPNPAKSRTFTVLDSVQEQALVQQAAGGFDEDGNVTGNTGVAANNAVQTVDHAQISDTYHQTDILA